MNSNATKRVAYISLRIYEDANRPETKKFRTRVCSFDSDHLCTVIKKGVRTYLDEINPGDDVDDNAVDGAIKRIRKMTCGTTDPGAMNLVQFIDDPHATLALLDSNDSPIIDVGLDIYLPKEIDVVDVEEASEPPRKKSRVNVFEVLKGVKLLDMKYLEFDTDLDRERNIADEIGEAICAVFSEINLGYVTGDQLALLKRNYNTMKNSLCFIRKHWHTLLRASFPHIPVEEEIQCSKSKLLIALADTTTSNNKSGSMKSESIAYHFSALSKLIWNAFAIPAFKEAIDSIRAETKYLTDLLERHRSYLKGKSSPAMKSSTSGKRRAVISAFKDNLNLVQLSGDEFHVQIDSSFRPNRPQRQRSTFSTFVKDSVINVFSMLRHSDNYAPVFLTDAMMGIDKFADDMSDSFMSPASRAI